jgi:hypothetical protein
MTQNADVIAVALGPRAGGWLQSDDKTVRVWLWRNQDLIDLACSRLTRNLTKE